MAQELARKVNERKAAWNGEPRTSEPFTVLTQTPETHPASALETRADHRQISLNEEKYFYCRKIETITSNKTFERYKTETSIAGEVYCSIQKSHVFR